MNEPLMRVEEGERLVASDCRSLKRRLGIHAGRTNLDAQIMHKIYFHFKPPNLRNSLHRFGYHYEIGHKLVVDHLVGKLARKTSLTQAEEKVVRSAMGRAYYKLPAREYKLRASAAQELQALGDRGQQIFSEIKRELDGLMKEKYKFSRLIGGKRLPHADLFANPIADHLHNFSDFESFGELADYFSSFEGENKVYE